MKKIMVINAVLALLFTLISIFGQVFANTYPYSLTISNIISFYYIYDHLIVLWVILLMVGGIFIISFISTQIGRKFDINLLKYTGTLLFSVIIIFFSVMSFVEYLQVKQEYKECLDFYVNQAKEEIKNDKVVIEYFGLVSWGDWHTIDSIANKYGVQLMGLNTSRLNYDKKARETYLEIVNTHLEKRNGKGWEQRMDKELDPYYDR